MMDHKNYLTSRSLWSMGLLFFMLALLMSVSAGIVNAQGSSSCTVTNKADKTTPYSVGDTITFTIAIKNNGSSTITKNKVSVSCAMAESAFTYSGFPIRSGKTGTTRYTYSVKDADAGKTLTCAATVRINGVNYRPTATVKIEDEEEEVSFTVEKEADAEEYEVGDTITYTVTICNTGEKKIDRNDVEIEDEMAESDFVFKGFPIKPGKEGTITYTYCVKEKDEGKTLRNTAYVTICGIEESASESVFIREEEKEAAISITKTADRTRAEVGDTITYTITTANEGDVTLRNVRVTDTLLGNLTDDFFPYGKPCDLLKGCRAITRTFTYTVECDDIGTLENTATVSAIVDRTGKRIFDTDEADVKITDNDGGTVAGSPDIYLYDQNYANPAGKNIFNTTGVGQTQYVRTSAGASITLPIRLVNTTGKTVNLLVTGNKGDSNWTVTYVNAMHGGTVITNEVTGCGWNPSCNECEMKPGEARDFIVVIKPRSGLYSGLNTKVYIAVFVEGNPSKKDVVVADICVR